MANFKKVPNSAKRHADNSGRPIAFKNAQMRCLTTSLCLKSLLITQHKVPLINTCGAKKGRETEKRTANVQMSRTAGVVKGRPALNCTIAPRSWVNGVR